MPLGSALPRGTEWWDRVLGTGCCGVVQGLGLSTLPCPAAPHSTAGCLAGCPRPTPLHTPSVFIALLTAGAGAGVAPCQAHARHHRTLPQGQIQSRECQTSPTPSTWQQLLPVPQPCTCPSINRGVPVPTQLSAAGQLDRVSAAGMGSLRRAQL